MIPGSANSLLLATAAAAAPTDYNIERSVRFNSSDSAYLSRTPASAGNRKTWTYSFWFKLGKTTGYQYFFSANNPSGGGSAFDILQMDNSASTIAFYGYNGFSSDWLLSPTAVFRDPSAWQHFVIAFDTTQATASNRVKWWHNGNLLTLDRSGYTTYPSLNADSRINNTVSQRLSDQTYGLDSYLADIHFIDGQALTPTSFGQFDANGVWQPQAYPGTYGTNGFHLPFSDNSTAAALGTDTSGNGNTWSVFNISVAAGRGNDSLVDTPTSYGVDAGNGGEVRGNYATLNPLAAGGTGVSFANGALEFTNSVGNTGFAYSSLEVNTGKWYCEVVITGGTTNIGWFGVRNRVTGAYAIYYGFSGNKFISGAQSAYGASYGLNDVIGIAYDADTGNIEFYKNGVSQGTFITGLGGQRVAFYFSEASSNQTLSAAVNFGQRPFAYPAPSGYKALCTQNLPTPTIADGSTVMDVVTYTGNNSTQSITGLAFSPDLVWVKGRNDGTYYHRLTSTGLTQPNYLAPNATDAEGSLNNTISSLDANGFTVDGVGTGGTNESGINYVGWAWDGGTSTVTNNDGSISSQVRANASAGFSIVTYTGTLSGSGNATVGHGLGVAPQFVITKARSVTSRWAVQMPTTLSANNYLELNTTAAQSSWGSQTRANPTSTVFDTVWAGGVNESGVTFVAYCFAPVDGYSSFGSYTGNGSADGPFVYTGFRPALVIVKMSSSTGNWTILDYQREGYNVDNDPLFPNLSNAEGTTDLVDLTSNGFKVRTTDATFNTNAGTYVYAAFAEHPFQYARAR